MVNFNAFCNLLVPMFTGLVKMFLIKATIINEVLMKLVRPLFRKVSHRPYTSFNEVTFLRFVSSRIIQQGIGDINRIYAKVSCQSDYY
jgi:hypothetical protein